MSRESDIIKLCESVLSVEASFYDNSNGGYEYTCPFCEEEIVTGSVSNSIDGINHDVNCARLIAKDLMTNIKGSK
jgi:hypothetical protein